MSGTRRAAAVLGAAALTTSALLAGAPTASAGPPVPYEEHPIGIFPVFGEDLSGVFFVNTTREDFCTPGMLQFEADVIAWIEGGEVGEPPEYPGDPEPHAPLTGQRIETRSGAAVVRVSADDLHVEVWAFDDGIVDEETLGVGPCLDTDEADTLLASGTASWLVMDNDRYGSGTRGNPWRDHVEATVTGEGGTWTWTVDFRFVWPRYAEEPMFRVRESLVPTG